MNMLYAADRLLLATSSYKLRPQGMAAQETGYKLKAVGPCVASYTELALATAVCSWLRARQCCLPAAQVHVATSSYKFQNARSFSVKASYKLHLCTCIRLQAEVCLM